MAAANYDEIVHSAGNVVTDWNSIDPLYKWDTHFPERLSRLSVTPDFSGGGTPQRRQKRGRNRNSSRFKTQPITFDEIKEVDEEPGKQEDRKEGLKSQFAAFSRSMDGLVPGFPVLPPCLRKPRTAAAPLPCLPAAAAAPGATTAASMPPLPPTNGTDVTASTEPAGASSGEQATNHHEEEAAVYAAVGLNPTLAQVQDVSRARRKKRRSRKSIEEEPELEKVAG